MDDNTNTDSVSLRHRTHQIFEIEHHGLARFINSVLMLLIAITVIIVFVETMPQVRSEYTSWFIWFEYFSIALFSIEYIARLWSAAEIDPEQPWRSRWRYAKSPLALIDLLAVAPFYLGLFIQLDTRYLRVVRLLRIFKLTRYSHSLSMLFQVLKNELPGIISALSILIILIVFASAGIYLVEREAQPEVFGSIPQAIWWATITLTTVGYGDVVPITFAGKVLGIVITIMGIGIAALPAGIIASGFTTEMQNRRDEFRAKLMASLSDGKLTHDELRDIERLRISLGLSLKESKALIRLAGTGHITHCPHCGKDISLHP
ncbi:MAG: ion transporter [Gammaproteobacteria bacterium]|nr:ion transporter [Gammaproteobacteria bacterium]